MSNTAKHVTIQSYRDIDTIPELSDGEFYEVYHKGIMHHYTSRHQAINKVLEIYTVVYGLTKQLPLHPPIIVDIMKFD